MKKTTYNIRITLLSFTLFLGASLCPISDVYAEMDPRVVALGTMAGYGVGGGALLGLASMAFGTGPRSVAQGASFGLYAGLAFGSYVVISHYLKKSSRPRPAGDAYPSGPYEETYDGSSYGELGGDALYSPMAGPKDVRELMERKEQSQEFGRLPQRNDFRIMIFSWGTTF